MKKRILLIGYNYYPEYTGIGKYSGEMVYWLARRGYDCTVITAYPYYPQWKVTEAYAHKKNWFNTEQQTFDSGGRITVHRCPMYIPHKPSGIKRMLLDFSFLFTASLKLLQLLFEKRMDLVVTVAPSFLVGLPGLFYKKIKKAKLLYHIQDMQIEAARDLNMIKSKSIIDILFKIERFILRRCDFITTISEEMVQKLREKTRRDVNLFLNSVDIEMLYPIPNQERLKRDFGFKDNDRIILYSGAIGEKQGLESILDLAKTFECRRELKFVICGSGPYKQKLIDLATSLQLTNIMFLPLQPTEKLNQFLNCADVHLVIQKMGASDLVMPSKLTSILAVGGVAVVTANERSGLYRLIDKNNIGILVEPENQSSLILGIWKALESDPTIIQQTARSYAENNLSIDSIMSSFETKFGLNDFKVVY
ncbi:WcaI family glycosyltransferase [Larkinella sp. VNQ87]|uniref:WcaI family glycosyltransferase n=1 Tax=Larkinella sp. VNQ87 TaxID=3400921 RepID=UPI003C0AD56D